MTVRRRIVAGLGPLGLLFGCSAAPPARSAHRATTGTTSVLHPLEATDEAIVPEPPTTTTTEAPTTTTVTIANMPATTRRTPTTVRFTVPEAETEETDEEWARAQPGYASTGRAALLACIRSYEQSADGYATNTGNGYYGAYQFDLPTWYSVGGTGLPSDAEPWEQDMRASLLIDRRGLAPWPTPSRRCG